MMSKSIHHYLLVAVFGMIGCSNLVYACDPGFVEISFTGKGETNAITDPTSFLPASLGSLKLSGKGPYKNIKLECGVRGVVTSNPVPTYDDDFEPRPFPDPAYPNVVTTTFTSYIVCGDHTEAVVGSTATLQLGWPGSCAGTYDSGNPINGRFEEPGTITLGKWGLLKGATGSFDVSGISSCGLQEWTVEATACVDEEIADQY